MLPISTGFITYVYYTVPKSLYGCTVQFHGIIYFCFIFCILASMQTGHHHRLSILLHPAPWHAVVSISPFLSKILACMSSHCFVLIFFGPLLLHENQDTLHLNMNVKNGGEGLSGRSKWRNGIKPHTRTRGTTACSSHTTISLSKFTVKWVACSFGAATKSESKTMISIKNI